jgi:Ca2+/H+ antiporter, TMEM165/GDT1 family
VVIAFQAGPEHSVESFLVSTGVVALGEMGDKTQLLAILLAARFRRPAPIIAGIFVATFFNHALAAMVGGWIAATLGPDALRWLIAASFLGMAAWMLVPDRLDDDVAPAAWWSLGACGATIVTFFVAEMGDKTQIATVALAARYADVWSVVAGTTLGMMLANVPAVLLGEQVARKVSMRVVHVIASAMFVVLGVLVVVDAGGMLGDEMRAGPL